MAAVEYLNITPFTTYTAIVDLSGCIYGNIQVGNCI
jgi:hypothetical protein